MARASPVSAAVCTCARPEGSGSTATVSGSATVGVSSATTGVEASASAGAAFICEVEVQPLRPAAATSTPIAVIMTFAGKP
ncbi:MAG: hypothetical protein E5V96_06015 [Mesorhizobium sp.]|uniref:hypothetical protein n=1 Tax=Mesorhizobium sp. TaxID=1871066 RepID=UPI00122C0156|nr:hypothetical protein [Mesorhizobium sp.]TIV46796.1 MAG: hypothetical protein E5V96_06015 [Mesorhizobium sp.]